MLLTPYGIREWLSATFVALVLGALAVWAQLWWAMVPIGLALFAVLWFFRDPLRRIRPGEPGAMLSPADGTISAVLEVDDHTATGGPAVIVRIFLSVLNVHVNRAPCAVEVVSLLHTPGRYLNAQTEASAAENESNLITLRLASGGETIGLRQVAGMIARRIVCPLKPGDTIARGERFGMIKFGSTTELILPRPKDVTVHVAKGDRVRGGITVLATLTPPAGTVD